MFTASLYPNRLYQLVDSTNPHIQLQSLRLLVNLSCNRDMIPSLLAAEVGGSGSQSGGHVHSWFPLYLLLSLFSLSFSLLASFFPSH